MIDWISCIIKVKHRAIQEGHVVVFDEDGVMLSLSLIHI